VPASKPLASLIANFNNNNYIYKIFCDNYDSQNLPLIPFGTSTEINGISGGLEVANIIKRFCIIVNHVGANIPLYLSHISSYFIIYNNNTPAAAYTQDTSTFLRVHIVKLPTTPAIVTPTGGSTLILGTVFTKPPSKPTFLTTASQLTNSYSVGGINLNSGFTADTVNFITSTATPKATFTLTRIPAGALINNIFKSTTSTYPRFKELVGTRVYTDGSNMYGGSTTTPHLKTRTNRKQFKKTRKNNK
jgi:hypothetical protein